MRLPDSDRVDLGGAEDELLEAGDIVMTTAKRQDP